MCGTSKPDENEADSNKGDLINQAKSVAAGLGLPYTNTPQNITAIPCKGQPETQKLK